MTGAQRDDLAASLTELLILSEIVIAIGDPEPDTAGAEVPRKWVRWVGEQTNRIAHVARDTLRDGSA